MRLGDHLLYSPYFPWTQILPFRGDLIHEMAIDHDHRAKSPIFPTSPISETSSFFNTYKPPDNIQMDKTVRKSVNLKQDDEMFFNISQDLLDRYQSKKWNVKEAMDSVLLPKERYPYREALQWRMRKLPIFPDANEDPSYPILREVNRIYGELLRQQMIPTSDSELVEKFGFESKSQFTLQTANKSLASTMHTTVHPSQHISMQHDTTILPPNIIETKESLCRGSPTSPLNDKVLEADEIRPEPTNTQNCNQEIHPSHLPVRKNSHFPHAPFLGPKKELSHEVGKHTLESVSSAEIMTVSQVPEELSKSTEQKRTHLEPEYYNPISLYPHPLATEIDDSYVVASRSNSVPKDQNRVYVDVMSRPRYQDFRPPSLHIPHLNNSTVVQALPTHIDIDWNIPVEILNHDSPIRERNPRKTKESFAIENRYNAVSVPERCDENRSESLGSKATPLLLSKETTNQICDGSYTNTVTQSDNTDLGIEHDYRLDITRRRCLLYIDREQTTRNATEKSLNQTKRILDEIDRVNSILQRSKNLPIDARVEYQSYQKELHHELQRWTVELNPSKNSNEKNESLGQNLDTNNLNVLSSPLQSKHQKEEQNLTSLDSILTSENTSQKNQKDAEKEMDKESKTFAEGKTRFSSKIIRNQVSPKRMQWRLVNVEAPNDLPEVSENVMSSDWSLSFSLYVGLSIRS
jgi:hypothetical protein